MHRLPRRARWILSWVGRASLLVVVVALLPALVAPHYQFPDPTPFSGSQWHNPYAGLDDPTWHTINLHAHSAAWGGVTNGTGTPDEVRGAYRRLGYDGAAVSNYHQLTADPAVGALSVYEHGMNVHKAHVLVVGAREVRWLDFPLVQTVHHQQRVLDHLRGAGALLAIPHPGVRGARGTAALRALTGYQLMEVTSKYGIWDREWDVALGAGRLVWALGGDDAHNVRDVTQVGESWTSVASRSAAPESLLAAMAAGRHLAVSGHHGRTALRVRSVAMRDGELRVQVDGPVTELAFVGPGGRVRHRVPSGSGAYRPAPEDAYVRVVVRGDSTVLYLNPVVRHHGDGVPVRSASVDAPSTWLLRTAQGTALLWWHGGARRTALRGLGMAWAALVVARRRRAVQRGRPGAAPDGGVHPVTR